MALLFEEKVKTDRAAFVSKVKRIAAKYAINPNWIMAVINSETGGTFSPSIYNAAGSGAVGLFQFMPRTAAGLGTSTDALARMTAVQQLDYVDAYIADTIRWTKKKIEDYDDLYFMVFYPAAIGKPDDWQFPQSIYSQNRGVDQNKDGVITVADFKAFIRNKIPVEWQIRFLGKDTVRKAKIAFGIIASVVVVVVATVIYQTYHANK
jgi:hypothetical protein